MDLCKFPEFEDIRPEHRDIFKRYFSLYGKKSCNFLFANIFSWKDILKFRVSSLDGNLIIAGSQDGRAFFYEPVGDKNTAESVKAVFRHFRDVPGGIYVKGASAGFVKNIIGGDKSFSVAENRDDFEYIYLTEELIALKGNKYHSKKNLYNQFKKNNNYRYIELEQAIAKQCVNFIDKWCEERECGLDPRQAKENCAAKKMLENLDYLELRGAVFEVNGTLSGLTIGEELSPDTFVVHVEKAAGAVKGLYQAINREFLEKEASGYKYVNREEDDGFPGLRKAKMSYYPVELLKKHDVYFSG
ncbi:MAG: phosphatidylglycerol lysyltransferase domain-containing protein [bacterium]|nr:phosphatidylglycerol lysyltransferase domain-containing protein [bacterium]